MSNWGNLLFEQAVHESEEEPLFLLSAAAKKYEAALAIKPDKSETLNNWGNALFEAARYVENRGAEYASGDKAARLFAAASAKYKEALAIEHDKENALYNWSVALFEQMKCAGRNEGPDQFGVVRQPSALRFG